MGNMAPLVQDDVKVDRVPLRMAGYSVVDLRLVERLHRENLAGVVDLLKELFNIFVDMHGR